MVLVRETRKASSQSMHHDNYARNSVIIRGGPCPPVRCICIGWDVG